MSNRIFCTFSSKQEIEDLVEVLRSRYTIVYNKIFVLATNEEKFLITYNLELSNISIFPENTILVHRKKATNTLYTINALNSLVQTAGKQEIDWNLHRNKLLLIRDGNLVQIGTNIYKIYSWV